MSKIRILHLTSTVYGIGGVEKLLLDMSDKYDESKFEILYCNLFCNENGLGKFPTALKERGLRYINIVGNRIWHLPTMIVQLIRVLKREEIDILHVHMMQATIIGAIAARISRTTTIATRHYSPGPSHSGSNGLGRWLMLKLDHYFTRSMDRFIAVSDHVKSELLEWGIPSRSVELIHNGIDVKSFDEQKGGDGTGPIGRVSDRLSIGMIGSLTKRKGHQLLLESFKIVLAMVPNVELFLVGDGPERSNLESFSAERGIAEHVKFLGFRSDVASILSGLDLYVHTAEQESFGIVILEAMAANCAVVARETGGIPEIVVNGETGFLTDGSSKTIAETICLVLTNQPLRKKMADAGRRRVVSKFDIRNTVEAYENIWLGLFRRINNRADHDNE